MIKYHLYEQIDEHDLLPLMCVCVCLFKVISSQIRKTRSTILLIIFSYFRIVAYMRNIKTGLLKGGLDVK